jgi:hypothetical protein
VFFKVIDRPELEDAEQLLHEAQKEIDRGIDAEVPPPPPPPKPVKKVEAGPVKIPKFPHWIEELIPGPILSLIYFLEIFIIVCFQWLI